jgi:antitoxin VapB
MSSYIFLRYIIESERMALSVKDPEVDRLVRRLAQQRGTTMTGAIGLAVRNELERSDRHSAAERERRYQALKRISADIDRSKLDFSRTDDEILGYDENGLPN